MNVLSCARGEVEVGSEKAAVRGKRSIRRCILPSSDVMPTYGRERREDDAGERRHRENVKEEESKGEERWEEEVRGAKKG